MKMLKHISSRSSQSGQIGVIILLIMVVLLIIGLSLASRSTQDLFISQQQAESVRVFNAAEAGIEKALSTSLSFEGDSQLGSIDNFSSQDVDVNYQVTKMNDLKMRLFEMIGVTFDVTGVIDGQVLRIDWAKESDCGSQDVASLTISVYFDDSGIIRVRHYPIAGCDRSDGFELASTINENGLHRRYNLVLQAGDQMVRIKPVYADTHVHIQPIGWNPEVQYYQIRSEATNTNGTETRIVEVSKTIDAPPSIMDFVLVSGGNIVK